MKTQAEKFGKWLQGEIESEGSIQAFEDWAGFGIRPYIRGWRVPKPWVLPKLANALSLWAGQTYAVEDLVFRAGLEQAETRRFGEWLRARIEEKGTCGEFARKQMFAYATVNAWANGKAFPIGNNKQVASLAQALSKWLGRTITAQEIAQRIQADPKFSKLPLRTQKRVSSIKES
jgi:hypothetical protein